MFVREVHLCQLVQTEKEKKNRIHYAIKDRCYRRHIYVAFLLSLPQCEPMARTGPVKSHTIISYFYAYNILCFIRFTYLIGSGISQSKDEYIQKLVLKFYDSCYGGKQSYRSLFFYQSYWCALRFIIVSFGEKHTTILTACNTSEANVLHLKLTWLVKEENLLKGL
jgi:hypothetical protein